MPNCWTLIFVLAFQAELLKAKVYQGKELFSNKDTTFVIGFPAQPPKDAILGNNRLYLTSDEYAEAYIVVPSAKHNQFARLQPGGTMIVNLNGNVRMPSKTGIKTKSGIRIYANASISVYGVDMVKESSDGFLALPLSFTMLGNEYMVMTYTPVMHSVIMVTASTSGTKVTFHLKLSLPGTVTVDGKSYKNGDTFNVSLNALDSFQLMADNSAGSLSGTRITSNKVISVYSGNDCAYVPENISGCDHLVEQIPPISTWGNSFIAKSTPYRAVGDFFHILASQDQTVINIEYNKTTPITKTINAGQVYVFDSLPGSGHVITTSKPCLVVQYGKSHRVDNSKFAPFMSIVPPINQWSNDYTLVVPSRSAKNYRCYANIIVSTREKSNIQAHPKRITSILQSSWSDVPMSLFSSASVNLTSGQYRFYHKSPLKFFSVIFICNADFEAFGFPAGLRLVQRGPSCTVRQMVPGDRKDNDCDSRVDEELLNNIDDDGDGRVDEDLATPIPTMNAQSVVNTSECYIPHISRMRFARTPEHKAVGMCNIRGDNKILFRDVTLSDIGCWKRKNRTWSFTDGCLNTIQLKQTVMVYIQNSLGNVKFPQSPESNMHCERCSPSSDFGKPTYKPDCTGSVSVTYSDSNWLVCRKCGYIDTVEVNRTWVVSNACSKLTKIQTLRFKNYGDRPWVEVSPQAIVSAPNKNITIKCNWWGIPEPQVTWILPSGYVLNKSRSVDEVEVLDDLTQRRRIKTVLDDNSLLISDTRPHDAGIYRCMSRNILGNSTAAVNVTVLEDIIDVDATITLTDIEYTSDLEDPESELVAGFTEQIRNELTKVFMNMTGFQEVKILGYRNGSVKVLFRVVMKKQNKDENPQVVVKKVGQHLAVSIKTGQLGDYKVIPTVELREKPPPPNQIKANEIKESEVHVEWKFPDLHTMFGISGYLLQYKVFGVPSWMTYDVVKTNNQRIDGLKPGTSYQIRAKAKNQYGHSEPSKSLEITTLDKGLSGAMIALFVIIPILVIIVCAMVVWCVVKKRHKETSFKTTGSEQLLDNGVVRYTRPNEKIHIDENHKWNELSRDNLELGRVLGEGQFGMVIEGKLTQEDGSTTRCAVKKLKRSATESDMKDLLNELDIMMQVGSHQNIVNLIGACAFGGPILVVVEFCANGNLLRYLQKQSSRTFEDMAEYEVHIVPKERLKIASEVANGMAHLARRRCVHRDLAARNVLLDESWTAKVSDFGLSRDVYTDSVYEKTTGGKLPAKWMAIEALEAGLNTTQSDVWSFGVLLWEIETGGCIPYPAFSAMEMLAAVKQGYRLEKPTSCSIALYNIMLKCWEADPSARPTFDDLYADLHQLKEATPSSPSYYENIQDEDLPTETYA